MKSRIGTINRKPIVQGDKNLVTPNSEIHVSELGGGRGQSDIPVEYYKVVALEGQDLSAVRNGVSQVFIDLLSEFSCFHILVKGTSSSSYRLFAGVPLMFIFNQDNFSGHAYAIRSFHTITKNVTNDGTIIEIPSFNNIFDALELIGEFTESLPFLLKKALVPITAEEFYNLDDME